MVAISAYSHEQFIKYVQSSIKKPNADSVQELHNDVIVLEQFFIDYQCRIIALRQLMKEYKLLHRNVRISLRRHQISYAAKK